MLWLRALLSQNLIIFPPGLRFALTALGLVVSSPLSLRRLLRLLAPLCQLVLPECPLVPLNLQPAVVTGRRGDFLDPTGRTLAHQFASIRVDASSLLVAGQCRSSGYEPRLQAAEQE